MTVIRPSDRFRLPVVTAQALFVVNAAIWIFLGILSLTRPADNTSMAWIVTILMFGNAAVMLWLGRGLGKQRKSFYYLAIAVLAVNIVLTVTDQFGPIDLFTLLFDAFLLVLLLGTRSRYMSAKQNLA